MKTLLAIAAILGMTSSVALADCAGHVTASAKVDKEITTASIMKAGEARAEQTPIVKNVPPAEETQVAE